MGIFLKGRQLKVLNALDKKSAHEKELEKSKNDNQDHRNLYLAQVFFPSLILKICVIFPYNQRFPVFVIFISYYGWIFFIFNIMDPNILQEGIILEGTPAAEGVSASDMEKRQRYRILSILASAVTDSVSNS